MKKCSVIKDLSPEVFVKLMVLILYWQYEPVKKDSVFRCGVVTVRDITKILTSIGLITDYQAKTIRSPVDGVNYRAAIQRYSGIYTNGAQELNNCSWLIYNQYSKSAYQSITPQSFITSRLFGLTELGAEKASTFVEIFSHYGLTKEVCLEMKFQTSL